MITKALAKKWLSKYLMVLFACLLLVPVLWILGLQVFPITAIPLLLLLLIRYLFLYTYARKFQKIIDYLIYLMTLEITPFKTEYSKDFYNLNTEWLEKYFYVEPYDKYADAKNGKNYWQEPQGETAGF